MNLFLDIEKHYKLLEDEETISFVKELDDMLEGKE